MSEGNHDIISKDSDVQEYSVIPIGKDSNFQVELNIGLALPFKYQFAESEKELEHSSMVKDVHADGSIYMLQVTTQSNQGPLQSVEFDVLVVLMSLLFEQSNQPQFNENGIKNNGVRVYYTYADLCRRLGIKADSTARVKKAIEKIKSQSLRFKKFAFTQGTNGESRKPYDNSTENTKIILKSGDIQRGNLDSDYSKAHKIYWLELDQTIVNNLYKEYISVISRKDFLSLDSGNQRRTHVFILSKRKKFGDNFIFSLEELAQVLGLSSNPKKRRQIGEFLEKVSKTTEMFTYTIVKRKLEEDWDISVNFFPEDSRVIDIDPFWRDLLFDYGEDKLFKIDLSEIDVINYRDELNRKYFKATGKDKIEYLKKSYSPGEYCLDVTLWQVIKSGYEVTKGFKPLVIKIMDSIIKNEFIHPEKYRLFVSERVEHKKKEEVVKQIVKTNQEKEIEKEENDKKFDKAFSGVYNHILTDKSRDELITEKAKQLLSEEEVTEENTIGYESFLSWKKRELAKSLMIEMVLFEDVKDLRKRLFGNNEDLKLIQ